MTEDFKRLIRELFKLVRDQQITVTQAMECLEGKPIDLKLSDGTMASLKGGEVTVADSARRIS